MVVGARVVWEENEKPFCVKQPGSLPKVYYYLFKNDFEEKLGREKVRKLRRWVGYASRYCCLLACNFLLFSKKDRLHPVFMIC